ncbi:MAG TPA: DUF5996 family protein [Balneolaceae bacterium]
MKSSNQFPPLPLNEWEDSKKTLHLYCQIVGKIRMELSPPQNHWWHVPLYVNTQGLETGSIPNQNHRFEINFNFIDHRIAVSTSLGDEKRFNLHDGLSVADFYQKLFSILDDFNIKADILAKPYDQPFNTPFAEDREHARYDKKYVERYWHILAETDRIFKIFNRNFCGKACPVQLYWHSFDLALTRFSGREAPPMPDAGPVDQEAYSHEVISFGFWAGDEDLRNPAFYSYTYPAPGGLDEMPLKPESAEWVEQNGSPMALLMYDDVRNAENPEQTLLDFLESAYRVGAEKADWNMEKLNRKAFSA